MIDHFSFIASIYDWVIGKPDVERLKKILLLPVEGVMLDAGGGTGRVSILLRHLVSHVVVSDLSQSMLKRAKQKGGLLPLRAHAEVLPFPEETFDRVLVVDSLHHFCNQEEALCDLLRVLKPGGRLVIEEPDITRMTVKVVALAEKLALMRSRFYPPRIIKDMIRNHGCSVSLEHRDKFRVWIIADKNHKKQ